MNECCQQMSNRREGAGPRDDATVDTNRDDFSVTHCIVCECRHFELTVDPGKLGLEGTRL